MRVPARARRALLGAALLWSSLAPLGCRPARTEDVASAARVPASAAETVTFNPAFASW